MISEIYGWHYIETIQLKDKKLDDFFLCSVRQVLFLSSGYYMADVGELDCTLFCEEMGLVCVTDMETGNTTLIFYEKGVYCSPDDSQKKYSAEFHPAYYPENGKCVGYHSIPSKVKCTANSAGDSNNMRRICNCMNKGKDRRSNLSKLL